ncbi:MAG: 3-oxoacyl-ACP reductase FabG [Saprospiraceae bacterium]|nr:3-oxoacyl-ACP reductase FabG [Saprospiraceae bacterium]
MKRLKGKVAIVTGGARGIGREVCRLFFAEGANVALWDVLETGNQTALNIDQSGKSVIFLKVDVTKKDQVSEAVKSVVATFGAVDILINNAGITRDKTFLKMTDDQWRQVIDVNLNGLYHVTKQVIPHMQTAGYGRIISASSVNGQLGAFGQTNYAASKAAVMGFTSSLAKEVGKYGITVNAIAPGFIKTDMTEGMPRDLIESSIAQIPVKRVGTPLDVAYAYLYLASEEAGFVNGTTLNVNGGVAP